MRGDLDLNDMKLKRVLDCDHAVLAAEDKVTKATGAPVGFAGPVGLKIPVYADWSVRGMTKGITGANEADTHFVHVLPGRDFTPVYADLRNAVEGDGCPRCVGVLSIKRGIEVGHVFKLGTKYSEALGATFLDEHGKEQPMIMGCYGIGVGRTAAASIEQNHDENGIIWPLPLAPFSCEVVPVNVKSEESMRVAEALYEALGGLGVETLIDDRDERAGVKFKDSDLIGIPVRVTVGERNLKEGLVEITWRNETEARLVKVDAAAAAVRKMLEG